MEYDRIYMEDDSVDKDRVTLDLGGNGGGGLGGRCSVHSGQAASRLQ
jgi:hypothetical protein